MVYSITSTRSTPLGTCWVQAQLALRDWFYGCNHMALHPLAQALTGYRVVYLPCLVRCLLWDQSVRDLLPNIQARSARIMFQHTYHMNQDMQS